ncbi:dihydrodipicolinate synthase family protein [Spirosoma areae]
MKSTLLPQGLIPVMLMPFTNENRIDVGGLEHLIEFYLRAGAAGLFANCLSTEMYYLSEQERLDHTRQVVEQTKGRVPVVASGTFGGTIRQQAAFIRKMYATGVDAVILITNQLVAADESDGVFLSRLHELLRLTGDIPLGLYECPVPYKRLVSVPVLEELVATGRIIYHKDTSCSVPDVTRKMAVLRGRAFGFYDAHLPNALASLRLGARGLSAIAGNFFPEFVVWLCANFDAPSQQQQVGWLQTELTRTNALIHADYPVSAKYFLQRRGLPITLHSRSYPHLLSAEQRRALDALGETVEEWRNRLTPQSVPDVGL